MGFQIAYTEIIARFSPLDWSSLADQYMDIWILVCWYVEALIPALRKIYEASLGSAFRPILETVPGASS